MIIGIDASRAYVSEKTGTEYYSYHLINEILRLPEAKSHTFVLFTRPNTILPKELDGYSNVIVKKIRMKYLWTQLGFAWETWQEPRIEVLWVPAHTLPILRNPKIKTVVTIHGIEYKWLPEYKNWLQRWYLPLSTIYATKQADHVIAVSNFTAKQLEKELHTDTKKIKVIYEGVVPSSSSLSSHKEALARYGIKSKRYLLFMGSIQPRKNLIALIRAFSIFAEDYPDYKLVIAGGVGWLAETIFQEARSSGVQEKIIFTGRVSEIVKAELYAGASVYVQPSITEGFGLPILEAMRAGLPVVSSDGGALPEVVGEAGIIVPITRDFVNVLTKALKAVVGDKKLQNHFIATGLKRAREFNWERAARKTLKVILG